ncbi:NAD(P)/FAD-dependent oxidoreductase [Aeromonas sp. QDB07]|uniref:NAD(P)/FAD-dependent oxidoreductase n=1 Tax=Aeromonas sp. QDB07 TaxID=2989838 RepID=UPI0022E5002B|nr:FAD/NAD(P)-binding oxidoreductase [Aeromonas sp. QDB07]
MATIIIGAGLGGMSAAYELKAELGKQHDVILVNDKPDFEFNPSNPWIAVRWRKRKDISLPIEPHVKKKGIRFIHAALTGLQPLEQQIRLSDGQHLHYDFLVLCTGPALAFEEVQGAGPTAGGTASVCTLSHAEECLHSVNGLLDEPGPVIVGAMPGASCFGPAYEYAFILDHHPARQEGEKGRAHDLCHQRTLHRSPRPQRRGGFQGHAGERAAHARHAMDLQCPHRGGQGWGDDGGGAG